MPNHPILKWFCRRFIQKNAKMLTCANCLLCQGFLSEISSGQTPTRQIFRQRGLALTKSQKGLCWPLPGGLYSWLGRMWAATLDTGGATLWMTIYKSQTRVTILCDANSHMFFCFIFVYHDFAWSSGAIWIHFGQAAGLCQSCQALALWRAMGFLRAQADATALSAMVNALRPSTTCGCPC